MMITRGEHRSVGNAETATDFERDWARRGNARTRPARPNLGRWTIALIALTTASCGGEEGPDPSLVADVTRLHRVVETDPAPELLEAVDEIADDRPIHAARALADEAIPAARAQEEAVRDAEVDTGQGRRFARRLARTYRARTEALESYREILQDGPQADTLALLDATRARRQAEEQLLTVVDAMSAVAPPPAME